MKRIHAAWPHEDLRIFSLTALIGTDTDDTPLEKAKELGLKNPMAPAGSFGESSAWLNLNHMPGLTYVYVVGKAGAVTWKGDPSRDTDEFLEALGAALAAPPVRPLPESMHPELSEAVAAYAAGDFAAAQKKAEKTGGRFAKKKGDDAARVAADAALLVELVDGTRADLGAALESAHREGSAEGFARAAEALRAGFPKSDEAERARELLADEAFAAEVEAWEAWLELERERPPTFPERKEKLEKRYAKDLEKHLKKHPDGPGAEVARAWLERYEAVEGQAR